MNKRRICSKCGKRRNVNSFSWKIKGIKKHGQCNQCKRKYAKNHYKNNRIKYQERNRRNNKIYADRAFVFIKQYLQSHSCVDCKISDIRILEFDHLRDKKYGINDMIHRGNSIKLIKKEIDKCDVVCTNCHRIRTYSRTKTWRTESKRVD